MNEEPPNDTNSSPLAVLTMVVGQIISELTRNKMLDPKVMHMLCDEVETAVKNDGVPTDGSIALLLYLKESIND